MLHLFNLFLVALVLLNAIGIGLLVQRWVRLPFGLSQAAGILTLCATLFFIEHLVGLGRLGWLMPLTTAVSGWAVLKNLDRLKEARFAIYALLAGFFYVFAWRYSLPNIDGNTERLPDLSFVVAYMQGVRLPPPDFWYPPHNLDHYYSFQHYGAALLGRWFALEPGTAYNVSYALLAGLTLSAAYELVALLCRPRWAQALVLATFLAGGTGSSLFSLFLVKWDNQNTYDAQRFVGGTTFYDDDKLTAFGLWVKNTPLVGGIPPGAKREDVPEMPMETFSYVVELGDYHAPLGGFWIQVISLGALVLLLRRPGEAHAAALLGATIPLTAATNTWSLPFQGVMSAGLLAFLWTQRWDALKRRQPAPDAVNWQAFLVGAIGFAFLMYPYFSYFLVKNIGNSSPIQFVPTSIGAKYLTPPVLFLMVFWPVLVVAILHFFGVRGHRRMYALFWLMALLATELFFVNDIYSGSAERFNTTLKWWPWVFDGVILTLAAANLDSTSALRRWGTTVVLAVLMLYTINLWRYFYGTIKSLAPMKLWHPGELNGSAWIRSDPPLRTALEFLRVAPKGVVLESPDNLAFCQVGAYSLFSQQPTVLGWTSHEQLWRGYLTETYERHLRIKDFYAGKLADPGGFLKAFNVRYVLWLPRDNNNKEALAKLSAELTGEYYWNEFYRADGYAVGIWSKK